MKRTSRLIRLFISSTFSDMVREREIIQSVVVPKVKKHCQSAGWQFEAIDLRWGISEEASVQHRTMRICINELHHCQAISPKPNFLVMIGQRYGWIPLPEIIDIDDATRILDIADAKERTFFYQRYFFNENYELTLTYEIRPDNELDADSHEVNQRLRLLLDRYAQQSGDIRFYHKYCTSATHQEIIEGIFKTDDAGKHIVYYDRILTGISDAVSHQFVDSNLQSRINALKSDIEDIVPSNNVVRVKTCYAHYISDEFLSEFAEEMLQKIRDVVDEEIRSHEYLKGFQEDAIIQRAFIEESESTFVGREIEIERLQSFVFSNDRAGICIVKSQPGVGKTSLLAHFAHLLGENMCIHYFIGKSPYTLSGIEIVKLMLVRLEVAYKPYENYQDLARKVTDALKKIDKPSVFILDGLDHLRQYDPFLDLSWLPDPIPHYVKLIFSWSDRLDNLATMISKYSIETLPLQAFNSVDFRIAFEKKLSIDNRRLTNFQLKETERLFERCQCDSLIIPLLCLVTRSWRSTDSPLLDIDSTQNLVNLYIRQLGSPENNDAEFVFMALGMLCFSRKGVTEDEILEIAALCDAYYDRLARQSFHRLVSNKDESRRIPYAIWSKCYYDMTNFLQEQRVGSHVTYRFNSSRLRKLITSAYNSIYGNSDVIYDQMEQYFEQDADYTSVRTVEELPYLYLCHGKHDKLIHLLGNPDFIQAKCKFGYVDELYDDLVDCIASIPDKDSRDIKRLDLICRFLLQQRSAIVKYAPFGNDVKKRLEKFQKEQAEISSVQQAPILLWTLLDSNTDASTVNSSYALVCNYCKGDSDYSYSTCSIWNIQTNRCMRQIDVPLSVYKSVYKCVNSYSTGNLVLSCITSNGNLAFVYDDNGILWKWDVKSNKLSSYNIKNVVELYADENNRIWLITKQAFYTINDNLHKIADNELVYGEFAKLYKSPHTCHIYIMSNRRYYYEYDEALGSIYQRELCIKGELCILAYHSISNRVWYRDLEESSAYSESLSSEPNLQKHSGLTGFVFDGCISNDMDVWVYSTNGALHVYDLVQNAYLYQVKSPGTTNIRRTAPTGMCNKFYTITGNNITVWEWPIRTVER